MCFVICYKIETNVLIFFDISKLAAQIAGCAIYAAYFKLPAVAPKKSISSQMPS